MSDISSVNSDQGTTPLPVTQDHTTVTTSSTQDTIGSEHTIQEKPDLSSLEQTDLASKEHELPPQAQKIVDAFLQSDLLSDSDKAEIKGAIPSVSSSSSSSNSTDDSSTEDEGSTAAETMPTSSYTQGSTTDTSDKTQSTENFTAQEQKIYDAALNSDSLSDTQKAKISDKPEAFMDFVESEAKHAHGEKKDKEEFQDQISENAKGDEYNPDVQQDTSDYDSKNKSL